MKQQPLLSFERFSLDFNQGRNKKSISVVDNLSMDIYPGEILGIVGESGCGKSVTALSILQLLPDALARYSGKIVFRGENLLALNAKQLRQIRGCDISIIFQEPLTSLHPAIRIGDQLTEGLRIHTQHSVKKIRDIAISLLERVHIPSPRYIMQRFPHELSGGMRQRVMIAMALAMKPALLIADEPTTALDVTIQAQILQLICELREEIGMAMLFITHDLSLIASICDRVGVMYSGRLVEQSDVETFFDHASHPYSQGLLAARLQDNTPKYKRLPFIQGSVAAVEDWTKGCRFRPRCDRAMDICDSAIPPPLIQRSKQAQCACYLYSSEPEQ